LMRCVEEDQTLGSLTPCATSDGKIIVLPWRKHHEEIARLVGAAFAGTEKTAPERPCSWCVGPKFATIGDPARDRMVSFCMTLHLSVKGPKSTILSVRDGNCIAAVAIVQKLKRVPPPKTFMDGVRIFGTVASLLARRRMPRGATALQKRGDIIDQEFHKLHTAASVGPHIYLAIIATAPAQQGKGYGGALLRAINRVADSEGLPAYLETGENNRSLYEHFGYEVVGRTQLDGGHRSDEEGEWPPCPLLGMVRQPVKSASASSLVETTSEGNA